MRTFNAIGVRHGEIIQTTVQADNWHEAIRRLYRNRTMTQVAACVLVPA